MMMTKARTGTMPTGRMRKKKGTQSVPFSITLHAEINQRFIRIVETLKI
jgi:hypothetical protein